MGNTLFSTNLRRLREAAGFRSQGDLAEAAGIGLQTVFRAESKGVIPRGSTIAKLAAALGVTEAQLFSDPKDVQVEAMQTTALAKELVSEMAKFKTQSPNPDLTSEEQELLDLFRSFSPSRRDGFLKTFRIAAHGNELKHNPKLRRG